VTFMEAAGFEPASRDISVAASTYVVVLLSFASKAPTDRVLDRLAGNVFLAAGVPGMTCGDPDFTTDFWASPAKSRSQGYRLLGSQDEVFLGK